MRLKVLQHLLVVRNHLAALALPQGDIEAVIKCGTVPRRDLDGSVEDRVNPMQGGWRGENVLDERASIANWNQFLTLCFGQGAGHFGRKDGWEDELMDGLPVIVPQLQCPR